MLCAVCKGCYFRLSLEWSLDLCTYYKLENTEYASEIARSFS